VSASARPAPRGGFFVQVVPALLYVFAVFYGGVTRPPGAGLPVVPHQDKLLHAVAFGFMQLVVVRAVRYEGQKLGFRGQILLAFALTVAVGGLLELVQMQTSYRSAELLDFVADAIGAGIVAAVLDWRGRKRQEACAPPAEPEG
jgi:VanZ family protein